MKNHSKRFLLKCKRNERLKIDVHVHFLPDSYKKALLENGIVNPDRFPVPDWDLKTHLETMATLGIATSMLSITSPGINFGDNHAAKTLAHNVNQEGAELVREYPRCFGLLASLPLPDIEASLAEIEYAKDALDVDGFTLLTNSQGVYLGDPRLNPVMEELNRRKAVVAIHPTEPSSMPDNVAENLPIPAMEYFFDTTRTITNMILNRTMKRFPDIKFIVPHAGAFLPILADRLSAFVMYNTNKSKVNSNFYLPYKGSFLPKMVYKAVPLLQAIMVKKEVDAPDVFEDLRSLYYDVAGFCIPKQLSTLLQIVSLDHLFYGSDYPHTPEIGCFSLVGALEDTDLLTDRERQAVCRDNALRLFPRLK